MKVSKICIWSVQRAKTASEKAFYVLKSSAQNIINWSIAKVQDFRNLFSASQRKWFNMRPNSIILELVDISVCVWIFPIAPVITNGDYLF